MKQLMLAACLALLLFTPHEVQSEEASATINVAAVQNSGHPSGSVLVYRERRWNEAGLEKQEWKRVGSWSLQGGSRSIKVSPGTFYVRFYAANGTYSSSEPFTLTGTRSHSERFEVSTVNVAAIQKAGYPTGTVFLYRQRSWNEAGLRKQEWSKVGSWSLRQGTRVLRVVPGTYYVRCYAANGTYSSSEPFTLTGTRSHSERFEVSTVNVAVVQNAGYPTGTVFLYRQRTWKEAGLQKREGNKVGSWSLRQGTRVMRVVPGTYYLRYYAANGTDTSSEPFTLTGTGSHSERFEVSTVNVAAVQNAGYPTGTVYLYRQRTWTEAGMQKQEWSKVGSWSLRQGTRVLRVVPGTYYVRFHAENGTDAASKSFDLSGTGTHSTRFSVSTINVAASQKAGYPSGTVYLYRQRTWVEAGVKKKEWGKVGGWSLRQGTRVLRVVPGRYYVRLVSGKEERQGEPLSLSIVDVATVRFDLRSRSAVTQIDRGSSTQVIAQELGDLGVAADSEEADVILKYSLDSFNPFATSEDIRNDLKAIRDKVLGGD